MKEFDISARAKKRLPLFVLAAAAIATVRFLEWNTLITAAQATYIETVVWIGIYLVVLNEFRKVEFQSRYFRNTFAVFSVCFLLQLLLDLPFSERLPVEPFPVGKYLDIIIGASWTVSCGLLLHSLLASVHSVEQESQAKEIALRQVEQSEQRLRTMFEAAKDSVFVKDRLLRYTHANRSMGELFGLDHEQLIGGTADQLFGAELAETVKAEDERVLCGETLDIQSERNVGDRRRTLHIVKVPMRNDLGEVTGLFGIVRDISERRRADAALQLAQFALDRAVDTVLWVRRDGLIVYTNDAARRHTTDNEQTERLSIWDIDLRFTPDSWESFWRDTDDLRGASYETEFVSKQDQPIEMEVRAHRFSHDDADLLCMFVRDITERKRLQGEIQQRLSELSHLSRMQIASEMVAGMAHELNQPLTAVANYSHILASTLSSETSAVWHDKAERRIVADRVQVICDESLRAGEIIRRLRQLVNKREHKKSRIGLNQLVMETLRIFDSQWADADNPVVTNLESDELYVVVDEIQIQQVLLNLLSNAKDAVQDIAKNASIVVCTSRPDADCCLISVEDNGKGFSDFGEDKLFQPFVSSKQHGMGLGLAISRSIARSHGGDLGACQLTGAGSVFHLTLPADSSPTEKHPNESEGIRR